MWVNYEEGLFNAFLFLYLHALASDSDLALSLNSVVGSSGEANSDMGTKTAVQTYMLTNRTLPDSPTMNLQVLLGSDNLHFTHSELLQVRVSNVYLPEQLTDPMKASIKVSKRGSVYTNPDLYIELTFNGSKYFTEIELKSTNNNSIPGSSVQQINLRGWLIFIKKKKNSDGPVQIATGLYAGSIAEKMPFPDRSPRPKVAFNTLHTWNETNLILKSDGYVLSYDESEIAAKEILIGDWRQALVSNWMAIVFDKNLSLKPTSPWFTKVITMFSSQLIEKYECLSDLEKHEFRRYLSSILANK